MIEAIEGRGVGAGKSFYVCTRIVQTLRCGGVVYAADSFGLRWEETKALVRDRFGLILQDGQYNTFPASDIPRLHEITPPGTDDCPVLIVVDEAHIHLNARDYARSGNDPKRHFFNWLTQSRHDNNDVIFITQHCANMDRQIMRLVTYIIRMRNMCNHKIFGLGRWPLKQFVMNQYDQDGYTLMDRRWMWHDKGIFGIYNSKVCSGSHKRLQLSVGGRRKLEKTKTRKHTVRLLILVAIIGLIYAAFKLYPRVQQVNDLAAAGKTKTEARASGVDTPPRVSSSSATPSDTARAASASSPKAKGAYDVLTEEFRGTDERSYLKTATGFYQAGAMSVHGFVEGVRGHVARIKTPEGRTLFVVSELHPLKPVPGGPEAGGTLPVGFPALAEAVSPGSPKIARELSKSERAMGGYPAPEDEERIANARAGLPQGTPKTDFRVTVENRL